MLCWHGSSHAGDNLQEYNQRQYKVCCNQSGSSDKLQAWRSALDSWYPNKGASVLYLPEYKMTLHMRTSLFTIFSFQKNSYIEHVNFVCYYYFPFYYLDDKLGKTFLSYTGLGNETGKFQNIKKNRQWIFNLFIGHKWKAYE